jgi:hypothetical protein
MFSFLNSAIILLSLSTATGVLLHDTRVDKAAVASLVTPAGVAYDPAAKAPNFNNDLHAHDERSSSIEQSIRDLKTENPRIQPRTNEDKKYLMQKYAVRGHHAFDNYNLPLV